MSDEFLRRADLGPGLGISDALRDARSLGAAFVAGGTTTIRVARS